MYRFRAAPGGQRALGAGKTTQKLDIDATATVNGTPLFDLDLASLEDKPWRKPGADVTDYFNYGFTEESWQIYCERQRKLRSEFGPMAAVRQYFVQWNGNQTSNAINTVVNEQRPIPKLGNSVPTMVQQQMIASTPSVINSLCSFVERFRFRSMPKRNIFFIFSGFDAGADESIVGAPSVNNAYKIDCTPTTDAIYATICDGFDSSSSYAAACADFDVKRPAAAAATACSTSIFLG